MERQKKKKTLSFIINGHTDNISRCSFYNYLTLGSTLTALKGRQTDGVKKDTATGS